MAKLSERELVAAEVLVGTGKSVRSVAKDLRVDESTLRYRLARRRQGAVDGRKQQPEACAPFENVIQAWIDRQPWTARANGRKASEASTITSVPSTATAGRTRRCSGTCGGELRRQGCGPYGGSKRGPERKREPYRGSWGHLSHASCLGKPAWLADVILTSMGVQCPSSP